MRFIALFKGINMVGKACFIKPWHRLLTEDMKIDKVKRSLTKSFISRKSLQDLLIFTANRA